VPGFAGFAVGRTLWHDALVDHLAGRSSDTEAAQVIADRYRRLIDAYDAAARGQTEDVS
jgi:myo-inositol catabolism protein IolC